MNNGEIARILSEVGLLLEIRGENSFKVRAYERAAEAVQNLPEPLSAVRERGELRKLQGVGEGLAQKLEELLDTGRLEYHETLRAEFPPAVFDFLKIPGLGAKSEQEILKGIGQIRSFGDRVTLGVATDLAQEIMARLRAEAPVQQMEAAGSLRRAKESIGDLDILVTSDEPARVMECFLKMDLVAEVVMHGPTKSTVMTHAGMQADLRVVAPESFGAALQYFTGSREHNIKLRDLAVRQGIKINEYGVFREAKEQETRLGGEMEEDIYRAVGLPMMPPELREDQGEIEAARAGTLPDLITLGDLRGDLQMHSTWSDGQNTIEEMARAARALGYEYIALTDHSISETVANGLSVERLRQRREEIEAARRAVPGLTILNGSEVDIKRDGSLDYPDEVLAELDFVIVSVHSSWKLSQEAQTARILRALDNPWVDAMAHPTGRLIGKREPYEVDLEQVFLKAAEAGVAMEINAYPDRLDLKDTHARYAKSLGVKLLIDTDAHGAESLSLIRFGVATARRGWIGAADVLNTRPVKEFVAGLRRRR